jgi:hypothetical protein
LAKVREAGVKASIGSVGVTVYVPVASRFGKENSPPASVVAVAEREPESVTVTPPMP